MNLAVIIAAAGTSSRYRLAAQQEGQEPQATRSKLDEDLGGRPVLQRTVELFAKHPLVSQIVVAGPHDEADFAGFKERYGDKLGLLGVKLVRGGETHRYQTVAAALAVVTESGGGGNAPVTHVAVHDAARPCCPAELIERVLEAAERHGAVVPGVEVSDTLKRVGEAMIEHDDDPLGAILGVPSARVGPRKVSETVDRSGVMSVQTPQVFAIDVLVRAYQQADLRSTDDAQLVERLGEPVVVVPGDARNIKITRPIDLLLARAILNVRGPEGRAAHKRF